MVLVDSNINAAPLPSVEADVVETLTLATVPGVTVTAHHPDIRRVYVQKVEVELDLEWLEANNEVISNVSGRIQEELRGIISAIDTIGLNGKSIKSRGWAWGESLYYNDLVARFDRVAGVHRIGQIWAQVSDDSGGTWSAPTLLSEVKAGADGVDNADFGLLHWGVDGANGFEMIEI